MKHDMLMFESIRNFGKIKAAIFYMPKKIDKNPILILRHLMGTSVFFSCQLLGYRRFALQSATTTRKGQFTPMDTSALQINETFGSDQKLISKLLPFTKYEAS